MAYVDIRYNVPEGDKCGYCSQSPRGTVVCNLFDEFLEEDENGNKFKCDACKERMVSES